MDMDLLFKKSLYSHKTLDGIKIKEDTIYLLLRIIDKRGTTKEKYPNYECHREKNLVFYL